MKEVKIGYSLDDVAAFLRHHGMRLEVRHERDLYLVMLSKSADEYMLKSADAYMSAGSDLAEAWRSVVRRYEDAQVKKAMDEACDDGPVHKLHDGWFFREDRVFGPFPSRDEAISAHRTYADSLEKKSGPEEAVEGRQEDLRCRTTRKRPQAFHGTD